MNENETKLASLKEKKRDPYDIKKFEEVLGESYMMVPDSESRLKKSLEDLDHFLANDEFFNSENNIMSGAGDSSSEWEQTARNLLKENLTKIPQANESDAVLEVKETDVSALKDDETF